MKAAVHVKLARAALAAVDGASERRELDLALAADPACEEALDLLGWLLLEPGAEADAGGALVCFTKLELLCVKNGSVTGGDGVARAASGDIEGARPLLEAAANATDLADHPERVARVEAALGKLDVEAGRTADGEARLRKAIDLEPCDRVRAGPLSQLGELLASTDRREEAERCLRQAIEGDPDHVKAHYLLSRLLARAGRGEESAREARIHELLRQLYDPNGARIRSDLDRKVRLREELAQVAPDCTAFAIASVRTLLEAKRYAEAEKQIGLLSKKMKPTAEVAFLLARARAGQGNIAGAEKARALMRQLDPNVPASLDRAIAEEWRRGAPEIGEDALEGLLARWNGR